MFQECSGIETLRGFRQCVLNMLCLQPATYLDSLESRGLARLIYRDNLKQKHSKREALSADLHEKQSKAGRIKHPAQTVVTCLIGLLRVRVIGKETTVSQFALRLWLCCLALPAG